MGEIDKDMEVVLDDDIQPVEVKQSEPVKVEKETVASNIDENKLINCLRNERVVVEFIPQERGLITDSRHVLYGGLGEESKRRFVVPVLQSGVYKNVLTNDEKDYLEYIIPLHQVPCSVEPLALLCVPRRILPGTSLPGEFHFYRMYSVIL